MRNSKPTIQQVHAQSARMAVERMANRVRKTPAKLTREQLEADIEAFKKNGGQIEVIENIYPDGAPLGIHSDYLDKQRAQLPKRRKKVKQKYGHPGFPV